MRADPCMASWRQRPAESRHRMLPRAPTPRAGTRRAAANHWYCQGGRTRSDKCRDPYGSDVRVIHTAHVQRCRFVAGGARIWLTPSDIRM